MRTPERDCINNKGTHVVKAHDKYEEAKSKEIWTMSQNDTIWGLDFLG